MGKEIAALGIAFVGIIAYLFVRGKGSNIIIEDNFKSAISVENEQNYTDKIISEQRQRIDDHVIPSFSDVPKNTSSRNARAVRQRFRDNIVVQQKKSVNLQTTLTQLLDFRKTLNVNDELKL